MTTEEEGVEAEKEDDGIVVVAEGDLRDRGDVGRGGAGVCGRRASGRAQHEAKQRLHEARVVQARLAAAA